MGDRPNHNAVSEQLVMNDEAIASSNDAPAAKIIVPTDPRKLANHGERFSNVRPHVHTRTTAFAFAVEDFGFQLGRCSRVVG